LAIPRENARAKTPETRVACGLVLLGEYRFAARRVKYVIVSRMARYPAEIAER